MQLRPRKIGDYLEICWRRKRTLFLMALVMLIATYFIIKRIPALYESRSMIVVTTLALPEDFTKTTSFASVMQQLTSRGNLASLVQRHKLYPQLKDLDVAIGKLSKDVKIDVKMRGYYPDGPESVSLTYRYPDPGVAQKVMDDLVAHFEKANESIRQQATAEAGRMNEKLVEIQGRLAQIAPRQSQEFIRNLAMTRSASEATAKSTLRMAVESSVETLGDKEFALQRQLDDVRQQITEQESIVRSRSSAAAPTNPAAGALLVRKAEIEAQLKVYETQYTKKNPKVIAAQEQLAQVNREIAKLDAGGGVEGLSASSPEMMELKRLRQQQRQLETDLEVIRRDLGRKNQALTNLGPTGQYFGPEAALTGGGNENRTEYDRLLVRYNALMDRQDMLMKLAGIAGSGAPMFQVIDAGHKPELPVAPNRMMLMMIAAGISLVFGLVVVFAFELPRMFMLNDERDVEYYLGAQVIALIPETTTPIERSRNRRLRWSRSLIFLLLAAGLIPAIILVLNRIQIFQILGSR
jgi:uncharacterized protein involved in exopolysaccharide biosynthesis